MSLSAVLFEYFKDWAVRALFCKLLKTIYIKMAIKMVSSKFHVHNNFSFLFTFIANDWTKNILMFEGFYSSMRLQE